MLVQNIQTDLHISFKKYNDSIVTMKISLKDFNFTEKILKENLEVKNLVYCISLFELDNMESVIRSQYVPKYVRQENIKKENIEFSFEDLDVDLKGFERNYLYALKVEITGGDSDINRNIDSNINRKIIKSSNLLLFSPKYGLITDEKVKKLYKEKYGKKIICQSEQDAIKNVKNEIQLDQLEDFLSLEDIKSLTLENRYYKGIDKFINNNSKFSRKMTDSRKKKVIYGANARIFFDEKMMKNNISPKNNPFMKNEWFMGGIYSYDSNYKKYI
jgi:hypothetical protein